MAAECSFGPSIRWVVHHCDRTRCALSGQPNPMYVPGKGPWESHASQKVNLTGKRTRRWLLRPSSTTTTPPPIPPQRIVLPYAIISPSTGGSQGSTSGMKSSSGSLSSMPSAWDRSSEAAPGRGLTDTHVTLHANLCSMSCRRSCPFQGRRARQWLQPIRSCRPTEHRDEAWTYHDGTRDNHDGNGGERGCRQ